MARQHLLGEFVVLVRELRHHARRSADACGIHVPAALPAHVHEFQQARDGFVGVAVGNHEACIGKNLDQRLDAPAPRGVLADVDLAGAVQVELAAHAFAVIAHQATPARGRALVDMEEIQFGQIGELRHPESGGAGALEDQVVFLRHGEAHRVDVLRGAEFARFPRLQPALKTPAEQMTIDPRTEAHEFFLGERGEQQFVVPERREALVTAQQPVRQRGAAPRVAHHEHRRFHLHPPEAGEEDAVQKEENGVRQRA